EEAAPVEAAAPELSADLPSSDALELTAGDIVPPPADELLLDNDTLISPVSGNPVPPRAEGGEAQGTRPYVAPTPASPAAPRAREGTLFERISSIARGAPKVAEGEGSAARE